MNNHHFYITDALPRITGLLEKVVTEYGLVYPQLQEIHQMFHSLAMHLITQMRKEELILFPYIQVLTKSTAADSSGCGAESIKHLLQELEEEHAIIEQTLADIRRLTQNYAVPAHVCNSYRLLFEWLEKFEKDIYEHEYLENNILFPKAIALEQVVHSRI
jgi:regulator of cell morphogenesis and NO signaling